MVELQLVSFAIPVAVSWLSGLEHRIQALVFDQQGVGSDPGRDACYIKLGR